MTFLNSQKQRRIAVRIHCIHLSAGGKQRFGYGGMAAPGGKGERRASKIVLDIWISPRRQQKSHDSHVAH